MNIALRCAFALSFILTNVICHDLCRDQNFPGERRSKKFKMCLEYRMNGCCELEKDHALFNAYNSLIAAHVLSKECKELIRKVYCQECSPKSAHLYEGDSTRKLKIYPNLCRDFCLKLYSECGDATNIIFKGKVCDPSAYITGQCYPNTDIVDQNSRHELTAGDPDCIPVCLQKITDGVKNLVDSAYPPDSTGRLFVLQQDGLIYEFKDGKKLKNNFLNFRNRIHQPEKKDERGLLSMVFHPDFNSNKFFYLLYNPKGHEIEVHIIRLKVTEIGPPMKFDPKSEIIILKFTKPAAIHNGGQLFFGNDGYLYITTGDGGIQRDNHGAHGNGQLLTTLLGKVLRIDVNTDNGYKIPEDNPFVHSINHERKEIFAYGFRNPWRASVDRLTGRIFLGDVGQNHFEEVNIIEKGGNYGWRAYEGDICFDQEMCDSLRKQGRVVKSPIYSFDHVNKASAVIGGYVYRGSNMKTLSGQYIFGDNRGGYLWALKEGNNKWSMRNICVETSSCPSGTESKASWNNMFGFGVDEKGEIYIFVGESLNVNTADGAMYKLVQPLGQS